MKNDTLCVLIFSKLMENEELQAVPKLRRISFIINTCFTNNFLPRFLFTDSIKIH